MTSPTPIVISGGTPAWGPYSSQSLRMAETFSELGHPILYIECGGDDSSFQEMLTLRGHDGGVVTDPKRNEFFVMRAAQLPKLPLTYPDLVRRFNGWRTSRQAARFLHAPVSYTHLTLPTNREV